MLQNRHGAHLLNLGNILRVSMGEPTQVLMPARLEGSSNTCILCSLMNY